MRTFCFILTFFISIECFSYYARLSEDPENFCKNEKNEKEVFCELEAIQLPQIDVSLLESLNQVSSEFQLGKINDLKAAYAISGKIIDQINDKEKIYKKLELDLDPEREETLRENLNIITKLKYDLSLLNNSTKCKSIIHDFKAAKNNLECAKQKTKKVEDLEVKIAMLISQKPILGLSEFEDLSKKVIQERTHSYEEKLSTAKSCNILKTRISTKNKLKINCESPEEISSNQAEDNYFNIPSKSFKDTLNQKIPEMLNSFKKIKENHSQVVSKISKVDYSGVASLREEIFKDRELSRDYYLAGEVENPESEFSNLGALSCRIMKEHKANEKNSMINSMVMDLGLMVIPVFGAARFAKAIGKVKNVKGIPNIVTRLTKYSQSNKVATLAAELAAMGVDTSLIRDEIEHCQETLAVTIGVENIKNSSDKVDECNALLNQMTMAYASGMFVGGLVSKKMLLASGAKKKMSTEEKLYSNKLEDIYDADGMNCHDNIHRLAKEFKNSGIDLAGAKVVYIVPNGISESQKLPYKYISGGSAPEGASWNHHVILVKDGKVYDPDFPRDRVPTVEEYMNEMFPEVMTDNSSALANVRLREFEAEEYISEFGGGSSAAGLRAGTDIRTVESSTVSMGDYYNRYTLNQLSVPSTRIPRGYDQYNNPVFLSESGAELVDDSGDAIELSGRITTLDGSVKWLDDEDIVEQLSRD